MFNQDFEYWLKISTYIWINLFFFIGTLLTVYLWSKFSRTQRKVSDTLDVVQGTAFSLYNNFDNKNSQLISTIGSLLSGLIAGRRRRR